MSRGNARMQIFLDEADYRKFFYVLGDVLDAYEVECWDFCAMPNHYHLALRNTRRNLSEALRHLNGEYATWWNSEHKKVGHVFQGRFKDQIVQREGYLLSLVRYIALNPVRAGLVQRPDAWPWSSYRYTAGLCHPPSFLAWQQILDQFGEDDLQTSRARYVRHVLSLSMDENVHDEHFRSRRRVIGDAAFKRSILGSVRTAVGAPRHLDPDS
jgi:REP element-mobilizing transposase RayT